MVGVLREAAGVVAIAGMIGVGLATVHGIPAPKPRASEVACEAPVTEVPVIRWVSQAEARTWLDEPRVIFVDARSGEEFQAGHVAGAISAPVVDGTLREDVLTFVREARTVVAYCDTHDDCARSSRLAGLLAAAGIGDVRILEGGMPGWLANGYPAEAGTCRHCP